MTYKDLLNDPQYRMVMIAAAMSFLLSTLIHFPYKVTGPPFYSDIVTAFWARLTPSGLREVVVGIPYVTYRFEYPTICGLVLWLGGWASGGSEATYTAVEFGILMIFAVAMAHFLYLLLRHLKLDHNRQLIFTIFAPTLIFYGAYNFDIIQAFFVVLTFYFFMVKKKEKSSALALGLAVATKLSPALLVPIFMQDIKTWRNRIYFALVAGLTFLFLNLPYWIVNYGVWLQGYTFLKNYAIEDSFLVWVFNSDTAQTAKDVSYVLVALAALAVYVFFRKRPLLIRAFLLTGIFVLFSYIAAPQLDLDLLPFLALVPAIPMPLFYFEQFSDVAIILSWFNITEGYAEEPGITQEYALARQVSLAVILVLVAVRRKFDALLA